MRKLVFEKKEWEKLKKVCEEGYPKEVCGLLFSRSGSKVERIETLTNILTGAHRKRLEALIQVGAVSLNKERASKEGDFEFVIDPSEQNKVILLAAKEGFDQIGLFHSHPDHPAIPSPTDVSQPFLSGWSNIVVSVDKGKFKEARSWYRQSEDAAFQEEKILVE